MEVHSDPPININNFQAYHIFVFSNLATFILQQVTNVFHNVKNA